MVVSFQTLIDVCLRKTVFKTRIRAGPTVSTISLRIPFNTHIQYVCLYCVAAIEIGNPRCYSNMQVMTAVKRILSAWSVIADGWSVPWILFEQSNHKTGP